jgi:phage gp16-like protein
MTPVQPREQRVRPSAFASTTTTRTHTMPPKREDTIKAFNRYVNMSAAELEAWLNGPECATAGTGVGLDSGERILGILQRNPDKVPEQYEDEDVAHMRKVVAYCKRHLAQEDKLKASKTPEQLEHTKSTIRYVQQRALSALLTLDKIA